MIKLYPKWEQEIRLQHQVPAKELKNGHDHMLRTKLRRSLNSRIAQLHKLIASGEAIVCAR